MYTGNITSMVGQIYHTLSALYIGQAMVRLRLCTCCVTNLRVQDIFFFHR